MFIAAFAVQVFLLPPESEEAAAQAADHAMGLLTSPLLGQRSLGGTQLLTLLEPSASWHTVSPPDLCYAHGITGPGHDGQG